MSQMRTPFERLLFVKDVADARILVDAAVSGDFPLSQSLCPTTIRSGAAFVFKEELTTSKKKKGIVDGLDWTHSRSCGPFLLYRQVAHIGLDPYRAYRQPPVQEESALFRSTRSRLNSTLIPNGLAKRTITITAKNQCRYRVINYFLPRHVEQFYNRSVRYKDGEGALHPRTRIR
ncbi:hypothetical protein BDR26DRAFT_957727 [Obelidium mucronatum]|nr:hypothetical protein BDR26DRAFT_957727 [Obelidium mucronatum]